MAGKERRKYHGTHFIYRRPRNLARYYREGWFENDQRGLRRQHAAFREVR